MPKKSFSILDKLFKIPDKKETNTLDPKNSAEMMRRFFIHRIGRVGHIAVEWASHQENLHLYHDEIALTEDEHREVIEGNLFLNDLGMLVPIQSVDINSDKPVARSDNTKPISRSLLPAPIPPIPKPEEFMALLGDIIPNE